MKNHPIRGLIVPLLLAALVCAACGPTKQLEYRQTDTSLETVSQVLSAKADQSAVDSLLYSYRSLREEMTELRETFAETVPQAQAQVTIPAQSLLDLPDGAKYGTSDGRATVEVQRLGDNYIATSRCDSVARQCSRYERQVFRQQNTIDSLNSAITTLNNRLDRMASETALNAVQTASKSESRKPPIRWGGWLAAGMLTGVGATIGAQALWKRFSLGGVVKSIFRTFK